ncbi:MAG: efflux RND transporter periplasmic adaptor subunit [Anaerolineales bacterium]|nr:efflux RND transporter periplasmic adaptor subunit [Anaerolineales bacterium]
MRVLWNRIKELINKNRKVSIGVGIVLLVVIVALVYSNRASSTTTTYQTEKIEKGNLVATVGATGTVRARQSANLAWQTSGTVETVNVKVSDQVKQDAVLASLSKASVSQNVILAEADLVSAQKALEDLQNSDTSRAQALIALKKAQDAYDRAYEYRQSLNGKVDLKQVVYVYIGGQTVPRVKYYKGYADKDTIAAADDDLALKKAQLDDAQRTYDRLNEGASSPDIAAAKARVAAAQATLGMAQIVSPFDGTVTQANPMAGDQVSTGLIAFRIDDLSHLLVDLQVSEVDINTVAIDQSATLTFDAILGKEYHGMVVEVGQAGDTVQGVVNFIVTIELTDADELVKPGMTSAVNVVIKEQKGVVLIPNRAVRLINEERVVYILVDNKPKSVKIQLGATDGTNSVLAGSDLKEGDSIILNPPSGGPFGG